MQLLHERKLERLRPTKSRGISEPLTKERAAITKSFERNRERIMHRLSAQYRISSSTCYENCNKNTEDGEKGQQRFCSELSLLQRETRDTL